MPTDQCCTSSEADGLIILGLALLGGLIYWKQSRWICGEAKAVSGHTIAVGKKEKRVRLHALYSLQPGQPWTDAAGVTHDGGAIAKGILAQQISGKTVKVRIRQTEKSFDRVVGQAFVGCEDVGYWMVKNGYAFADRQDENRDPSILRRYRKAEQKAKRKGLGFHAGSNEDPREWIARRIREQFAESRPGTNPDDLARTDEDLFMKVAKEIAKEIGEEIFVELASEFFWMVVLG